jgi:hypothetical protein
MTLPFGVAVDEAGSERVEVPGADAVEHEVPDTGGRSVS